MHIAGTLKLQIGVQINNTLILKIQALLSTGNACAQLPTFHISLIQPPGKIIITIMETDLYII
jgi:hypothetical protein